MICIHQRKTIKTGSVCIKFIFRSASKKAADKKKDAESQFCNKLPSGKFTPILSPACKVIVVAGGTGGIGMATAHQLLAAKADRIALIDTDICSGKKAVEMLNCAHGKERAMFFKADLSKSKDVAEAFKKIREEYHHIHLVVNTAGVWNEKSWESQVGAEVNGTINVTLESLEHMEKGGFLINTCGTSGITNFPLISPYPISAATSGAVISFCRSLGHPNNYAKTGIRIIALCVGITNTSYVKAAEQRTLKPYFSKELEMFIRESNWQKPESCARCIMQLIQCAPTGTVWVSEGSQLFRVDFPHWKMCSTLQAQYV